MGYHNGKYSGWENWKPNYISGNTLWLDGKDFNSVYLINGIVSGWIDKSITTWSPSKTTPTEPGVIPTYGGSYTTLVSGQEIAGESGWVKCINIALYGRHQAQRLNSFTDRNRIKISFTYFVPEGSEIDGIYFTGGNNIGSHYTSTKFEQGKIIRETNIIVDIRMATIPTGTNDFGLGAIVGGNELYTGTTEQIWYVKDYYEEVWDGNSAYQSVLTNRPSYSNGEIIFNGVDEFLDLSEYLSSFSGDTQGEFISVFKRNLTSNQTYLFSYGTSSTNNDVLLFDHASTTAGTLPNDIRIYSNDNGIVNAAGYDSSNIDNKIISWSSDGSSWKIFKNNNELSGLNTSGNNNGTWFSDISIGDGLLIGKWAGATVGYGDVNISEIIYYNRQLTNKERKAIFHYLNTKYSIY